ncbi:DUF3732 domain-containing protein [Paragemmobacter ruber]|uniref:DUF3732 domain-containing protein n=1 Tax=Paragemmobacter ruber TaxID=1985673 RepID=A0ABW9YAP7_9RHOB|nr:DUF3732 domain-containing protein [Rhodobacter ruber]NBE09462.1 DUF3732 domain-containing protein [Rhodobacter ruber]
MQFQILKLVLWPRGNFDPRVIEFAPGKVNVISGASKTGKSAVIPIIDYCLCSNKCAIPVGTIRESCEWFGVVISTVEGEKLLARREPGDQKQTGDMYFAEGESIVIPHRIEAKNSNTDQIRALLNRLSGLSNLGMDPNSEGYAGDRTSFRDLMAFTFQPQNIIANPDVLFFKADTTEHREKLKAIFPYILNAVTQETLAARWELERLERLLRQREAALSDVNSAVRVWMSEAQVWLQQGREFGLIQIDTPSPSEWMEMLGALRTLSQSNYRAARPTMTTIEATITELEELRSLEGAESATLSRLRQRLMEINRLLESSKSYGSALHIQRDRLAISDWLRQLGQEGRAPLEAIAPEGKDHLDKLCEALDGLELEIRSRTTVSDKMDKEQHRLRAQAEESLARLGALRAQIADLERRSEAARAEIYRADQVERYLGRLEQALKLYEKSGEDSELRGEIDALKGRITPLRAIVSEQLIRQVMQSSLATIENIAGQIIPKLDAEWPDAPIKIVVPDLTIKIVHGTRDDYLWEIGSGANWLAYHVSVSLALQRFFLRTPAHPVPGFLIYDQPSQVYFPKGVHSEDVDAGEWRDEDIEAVRKVFAAVSAETVLAKGRLQVVLLDHAAQDVWNGIDNIHLVDEWRGGEKLVPLAWLASAVS